MIKEIIQQAPTGFGDCVTGYVSMYVFKSLLEKRLGKTIKLSIGWQDVNCPFINDTHLNKSRISVKKRAYLDARFDGPDGTLQMAQYYNSPQMAHDIKTKEYLIVETNQYLGKCFVDKDNDRELIKRLTYEGYHYFWHSVLDQTQITIPECVRKHNFNKTFAVYLRLGDDFLCDKDRDPSEALANNYRTLKRVDGLKMRHYEHAILLGDVANNMMKQSFEKLFSNPRATTFDGTVEHSCGSLSKGTWEKIMTDLYIILKAKAVVDLSDDSNFPRIVLFLRGSDQQLYANKTGDLVLYDDPSLFFAKHYIF